MTIVDFPRQGPDPARSVAALARMKMATDPRCDVTMAKDDRARRYLIWTDAPGHWIGEVWFGPARHRRRSVFGVHDARALVAQFTRELRDLLADGWIDS